MADANSTAMDETFVYHVLRYAPDLIRDEWVNIGVIVFDPMTGALRLRMVEEQDEFARIRKLQPTVDENVLRRFRDNLEDRFATHLQNQRAEQGGNVNVGEELSTLIDKWNSTLSNGIQLAPEKGLHANDLDAELERLFREHVAPPRRSLRIGMPGSRAVIRSWCSQVWKTAGLWNRIEKSVRVGEFTFPGDPMRIDYAYRRNGTRGFVQTLSVSRSPADCKLFAYTAARIAARAPFASEFAAVTDVRLEPNNERHRFVRDTLMDAGIEPVGMDHFAVWVPKLKPTIH